MAPKTDPEAQVKYFSETIGYPAMRRGLRARGWVQVKGIKKSQQLNGLLSCGAAGSVGFDSTIIRQYDN